MNGLQSPQMSDVPSPAPEFITIAIRILRPSEKDPKGYIGAISKHPPLPGEDWCRGSDLADGPCDEATLLCIADDVRAVMEGFPKAYYRDNPQQGTSK